MNTGDDVTYLGGFRNPARANSYIPDIVQPGDRGRYEHPMAAPGWHQTSTRTASGAQVLVPVTRGMFEE